MITQAQLKVILHYCPVSGHFVWKVDRNANKLIGKRAGYRDKKGYRKIMIDEVGHNEHRLAWLYMTGNWPEDQIDHINNIKDDNSFANLRQATNGQNQQNIKMFKTNKSGYKNVSWHKIMKKWVVLLRINNKTAIREYFSDVNEAGQFAEKARKQIHKEFSTCN